MTPSRRWSARGHRRLGGAQAPMVARERRAEQAESEAGRCGGGKALRRMRATRCSGGSPVLAPRRTLAPGPMPHPHSRSAALDPRLRRSSAVVLVPVRLRSRAGARCASPAKGSRDPDFERFQPAAHRGRVHRGGSSGAPQGRGEQPGRRSPVSPSPQSGMTTDELSPHAQRRLIVTVLIDADVLVDLPDDDPQLVGI